MTMTTVQKLMQSMAVRVGLTVVILLTVVTIAADFSTAKLYRSLTLETVAGCASSSFRSGSSDRSSSGSGQRKEDEKMNIFIGIFSTASRLHRRSLLRIAYGLQLGSPNATESTRFTIMFVTGQPRTEQKEELALLRLEMAVHKDILLLDCPENMNEGKTYHFFSALALGKSGHQLNHYNYIMKADDDTYIRLTNLATSLLNLPREDLYYGYILPCNNMDAYNGYMAGMGYLLSSDLVAWISNASISANNHVGTEDQLVGKWLQEGGKAKNRVNKKPLFYDHPEFGGQCAHEFIPETILIHQLKNEKRWASVLLFFEGVYLTQGDNNTSQINITQPIPL